MEGKIMKEELTPRQRQILTYIGEHIKTYGYPPSVREICKATKLKSTATVHGYLVKLEQKGYLNRNPQKPRAIELRDKRLYNRDTIEVPLVGKVTAGKPILAEQNIETSFMLPKEMVPDAEVFLLEVKGDSMVDAGILSGDYVVVRAMSTAENGDIVVALIEDEATIKRFYKEDDFYRLQPENKSMKPMFLEHLTILGTVTGLFRQII